MDIDRYRLLESDRGLVGQKAGGSLPGPALGRKFLKGPIPLDWLATAVKLRDRPALVVGLALWFQSGLRRSPTVTLPRIVSEAFGLGRQSQYKGLKALEAAGLVSIMRRPGCKPVVTLLPAPRTAT